jgi:hypothetical protein
MAEFETWCLTPNGSGFMMLFDIGNPHQDEEVYL